MPPLSALESGWRSPCPRSIIKPEGVNEKPYKARRQEENILSIFSFRRFLFPGGLSGFRRAVGFGGRKKRRSKQEKGMTFGTLGAPCGRSPERAYTCLELKGKRGLQVPR